MQNLSCKNKLYLHENKNLFHFNSFVHSLALGQRVGVTWKWPITACFIYWGLCFYCSRGLLDARLNNYAELLRKKIPLEWSVMLIFDNINIYKGHSRHIRLKKSTAPSMWNFTVRAVLKPNICGMEYLWRDPDTATKPQGKLKEVKSEQLFIG